MNKYILIVALIVCPVVLSLAQPASSYELKQGGSNQVVTGQNRVCTRCTCTTSGMVWTDYGFYEASTGTTTYPSVGSSGSVSTSATASLTFTATSLGTRTITYRSLARTRNWSGAAGDCLGSAITPTDISTFTVTVTADLTTAGSFPSTICQGASALNLYSYVNKSSGVTFYDGGSPISSSFDPASYSVGNHTITASYAFSNGTTTITVGTIDVMQVAAVSANPSNTSTCPNANATFTASGTGSSISYNWQESANGGVSYGDLSNASYYSGTTTGTLTLTGVPSSYAGRLYRLRITNTCGSVYTNGGTLSFYGQVPINSSPSNQSVCPGGTAIFSASSSAQSGGLTYQWQWSGDGGGSWSNIGNGQWNPHVTTVSGATSATITFTSVTSAFNTGRVRCVIQDACGAVNQNVTSSATLTVYSAPSISSHPANASYCENSNASLSVTGSAGNGGLSYQWQASADGGASWANLSNGGIYSGSATGTLSLSAITSTYNGYRYRCILTDGCSSVQSATSNSAILTMYSDVVINIHPSNSSICPSSNTSFTVSATSGNGALSYQWQDSADGGSTWSNVCGSGTGCTSGGVTYSGLLSSTMTISSATAVLNGRRYRCIVSDGCGSVGQATSNAAILTVYSEPTVSAHPSNASYCENSNASFTVSGSASNGALLYQWQLSTNGGSSWGNVSNTGIYSGATSATLTLTGVTSAYNSYRYRAVLSDGCSAVQSTTSNGAILTMYNDVIIDTHPANSSICPSSNTSFSVSATSGNGALSYQWQVSSNGGISYTNVTNIGIYTGATSATLTLTGVTSGYNSYRYRAVITDGCGSVGQVTSNAGILTVNSGPSISAQPTNTFYCENGNATFTVSGSGPNYQWQVSTDAGASWANLSNGGIYSGATTTTLTLTTVTPSYSGNRYRVVISDGCSPVQTVTSNNVTLTMYSDVVINTQPSNSSICPSSNTSFTVSAASGNGALSYQWQVSTNGGVSYANVTDAGIYTGATTATLTLTNVTAAYNSYRYRVAVTDACGLVGAVTSNAGALTVNSTIGISAHPLNQSVCASGTTSFSVTATGAGLMYQWQESTNSGSTWANISNTGIYSGATSATLTLTGATFSYNNYQYRAAITGTCSNSNSNAGTLTVIVSPAISTDPVGSTVCEATVSSFSVTSSGTSLTYQWEYSLTGGAGSFNDIVGATTSTYNISSTSLSNDGYYRAKVSNSCSSSTSSSAKLTVNPLTVVDTPPIDKTICPSGSTTFSVSASGTGTLSYQWQLSTNNGSTYSDLSNSGIYTGAATANLNLGGATILYNDYKYRVKVTGGCGVQITSTAGTLFVNPTPSTPTAVDVARCGDGSLAATATSASSSPTFKWYQNDLDVVPVFTGATYTISNLTVTTSYFVSVTSLGCESAKEEVVYTRNAPQNVFLGAALSLCTAQGLYNLENDITDLVAKGSNFTWTANSTNYSSKNFDPSVGAGSYVVSYDPPTSAKAFPFCYALTTRNVQVTSSAGEGGITFNNAMVSNGNTVNMCIGDSPIDIATFPSVAGGSWSTVYGTGLSFSGSSVVFIPNTNSYTAVNPNTFRYSVNVGGCTASKDLLIYVKDNGEKPIVTGVPSSVCPGTKLNLSATVSSPGTFSYIWFKTGQLTPFATGNNIEYTVSKTETFEIRSVNSPFGCSSQSTLVNINTPFSSGSVTADKSNIPVGEKVKFTTDAPASGNTFGWNFGDGFSSVEREPIHHFFKIGEFKPKLTITATLGCSQTIEYDKIVVTGKPIEIITGVPDYKLEGTSVYPNPVEDILTVTSEMQILNAVIYDMSGSDTGVEITKENDRVIKVNVSFLKGGLYLLLLRTTKGQHVVKVNKK